MVVLEYDAHFITRYVKYNIEEIKEAIPAVKYIHTLLVILYVSTRQLFYCVVS